MGKQRDQPKKHIPWEHDFPCGTGKHLSPWQQLSDLCFLPQNGVSVMSAACSPHSWPDSVLATSPSPDWPPAWARMRLPQSLSHHTWTPPAEEPVRRQDVEPGSHSARSSLQPYSHLANTVLHPRHDRPRLCSSSSAVLPSSSLEGLCAPCTTKFCLWHLAAPSLLCFSSRVYAQIKQTACSAVQAGSRATATAGYGYGVGRGMLSGAQPPLHHSSATPPYKLLPPGH